jgi:hypothetical protein
MVLAVPPDSSWFEYRFKTQSSLIGPQRFKHSRTTDFTRPIGPVTLSSGTCS